MAAKATREIKCDDGDKGGKGDKGDNCDKGDNMI